MDRDFFFRPHFSVPLYLPGPSIQKPWPLLPFNNNTHTTCQAFYSHVFNLYNFCVAQVLLSLLQMMKTEAWRGYTGHVACK